MNQYYPDCPIAYHLHVVKRTCGFRRSCSRLDKGTYVECGYKCLKQRPKDEKPKITNSELLKKAMEGKL